MVQRILALLVVLIGIIVVSMESSVIAGNHIEWEIKNRYRTFDYKSDGLRTPVESAKVFERYSPKADERIHDWLQRIVEEIPSPFIADSGPWIEAKGVYKDEFIELPKHFLLEARIVEDDNDSGWRLESGECSWQVTGRESTHQSCREPLIVEDFDSGGAEVAVLQSGAKAASIDIKPNLKIILGLGDSYASGEGNPDSPAIWKKPTKGDWPPRNETATNGLIRKPARWWSNRCDRSFYSYQNLVALRVAFENPHAVVAFVHLACSGAEIIDGILAPQRYPPGHSIHRCQAPRERSDHDRWDPECDVPFAQLDMATALLCRSPQPLSPKQIETIKKPLSSIGHNKSQVKWIDGGRLRTCDPKALRDVDRVLLSIGGNDIGFSGLIAYALMPQRSRIKITPASDIAEWIVRMAQKEGKAVCPYTSANKARQKKCAKLGMAADLRIQEISSRYQALKIAMDYALPIDPKRILVNQYPNPLRDGKGNLCGNPLESEENNEWKATHILLPSNHFYKAVEIGKWQINLTEGEASEIESHDINPLNNAVRKNAMEFGWSIVPAQDAMETQGWCTGSSRALLGPDRITSWHPYAPNHRFIRTANDSFLTQWPSTENEKESKSQSAIERGNGFNGTFHPNAQGHASIAEQVILQLQDIQSKATVSAIGRVN